MKKFELKNVAKYVKTVGSIKTEEEFIEGIKEAAKKDGYHNFNNRDLVLLLIHKLEKTKPERMLASTMLREIGILNIFTVEDENPLMNIFQYCISIIMWLEVGEIED